MIDLGVVLIVVGFFALSEAYARGLEFLSR